MKSTSPLRVIRSLTGMEEWIIQPRLDKGEPNHAIVAVAHITNPAEFLSRDEVLAALLQCTERFLYLRAVVDLTGHPGECVLREVNKADLPRLIDKALEFQTIGDWKAIVQHEMSTFCPTRPDYLPWKVYFIKSAADGRGKSVVVHVVDHLIEDGRSTQLFFNDFLANLSALFSKQCRSTRPAFPFEETPSYLERHTESFSWWHTAKEAFKEMTRSYYATDQLPGTLNIPYEKRQYVIEYFTLTERITSRVIAQSKEDGVSVTSYMIAVVLIALERSANLGLPVSLRDATLKDYFTVQLGIDLRPYYKASTTEGPFNELFGNHASGRRGTYGVSEQTPVTELAKCFDTDTKQALRSMDLLRVPPRIEKYIPKVSDLALKNNGRTNMLTCVSLGVWSYESLTKFRVNEYYLTGPVKLIGPSVYFNMVTVNRKLNLTITFIKEIFPAPFRECFLVEMMRLVEALDESK